MRPDAPAAERGLQFIAMAGNILRQFEFVQNAWSMSTTFAGLKQESDPLIGIRQPLVTGEDGKAVMEIIFAAYESAGTGKKVELPFQTDAAKPWDLWKKSKT